MSLRRVLAAFAAAVLGSGCFFRTRPMKDADECRASARGRCEGTVAGADVSGPLDPGSEYVFIDPEVAPQCGGQPRQLVLSCRGGALRVTAVFGGSSSEPCAWSTDNPIPAPAVVSAPFSPAPAPPGRYLGTVAIRFADSTGVNVTYDIADETRCEAGPPPIPVDPAIAVAVLEAGVWLVSAPIKLMAGVVGHTGSSSGHSSSNSSAPRGHAHHHHHGGHHHHH